MPEVRFGKGMIDRGPSQSSVAPQDKVVPRFQGRTRFYSERAISVDVVIEKIGIKEMIDRLTSIQDVQYSKAVLDAQHVIARQAQQYWRLNVYKYYNARIKAGLQPSGRLGNACMFYVAPGKIKFFMSELHHPCKSGNTKYSYYIVNGAPGGSRGRYSRKKDYRIVDPEPEGFHPGTMSNVVRWAMFMGDWRGYVERLASTLIFQAVTTYLGKRRSIYGYKGVSYEDKNILLSRLQPRHGRPIIMGKADGVKGWKGHYMYGYNRSNVLSRSDRRSMSEKAKYQRLQQSLQLERELYEAEDAGKENTDIDVADRNRLAADYVIEANPWKRIRDQNVLDKETQVERQVQKGRTIRNNMVADDEYGDLYASAFEESLGSRRKEYGGERSREYED